MSAIIGWANPGAHALLASRRQEIIQGKFVKKARYGVYQYRAKQAFFDRSRNSAWPMLNRLI